MSSIAQRANALAAGRWYYHFPILTPETPTLAPATACPQVAQVARSLQSLLDSHAANTSTALVSALAFAETEAIHDATAWEAYLMHRAVVAEADPLAALFPNSGFQAIRVRTTGCGQQHWKAFPSSFHSVTCHVFCCAHTCSVQAGVVRADKAMLEETDVNATALALVGAIEAAQSLSQAQVAAQAPAISVSLNTLQGEKGLTVGLAGTGCLPRMTPSMHNCVDAVYVQIMLAGSSSPVQETGWQLVWRRPRCWTPMAVCSRQTAWYACCCLFWTGRACRVQ
jgi:hypothetical protein